MIKYENDCVNCGLPCIGNSCSYINVPHFYCDECTEEAKLYYFDDEQLCLNCIENRLQKVIID